MSPTNKRKQSALATAASETPATTQPAVALPQEWLRVKEAMGFSRMSKGSIYALINEGKIKSFSNKQRGQIKGTRLISFDSLRAYLNSNATGGEVGGGPLSGGIQSVGESASLRSPTVYARLTLRLGIPIGLTQWLEFAGKLLRLCDLIGRHFGF